MTAATVVRVDPLPACNANLLLVKFTKTVATDILTIPSGHGTTVVYCDFTQSDGFQKDVPSAVSGLLITLATGTGTCYGIVAVQ